MRFAFETGIHPSFKGPPHDHHRRTECLPQHDRKPRYGDGRGAETCFPGVIVSLLGQRVMPLEAAAAGAWIHGAAGDLAAREIGEYGMIPEDIIERLPRLLR